MLTGGYADCQGRSHPPVSLAYLFITISNRAAIDPTDHVLQQWVDMLKVLFFASVFVLELSILCLHFRALSSENTGNSIH